MKILVLQLARLGDIYMTWPALKGLRRQYPNAEIHLLTRPRFEGAVEGLQVVDRHWSLPSGDILMPLVQEEVDIQSSLQKLEQFLAPLQNEKFDWIINATFSPASSYLTAELTHPHARVSGYSRHADGSLNLADEVSAYFYAQVGLDKPNRIHVSDILGSMLEIQYTEEDWTGPQTISQTAALPERYIVLHVGASDRKKAVSPIIWTRALKYFSERYDSFPIVLVGAAGEAAWATEIATASTGCAIFNLVGRTQINDLFTIIRRAELLIGCDSAPIHMASLTDTPTLNVSVGDVNYWETGPKATLSFIYRSETEADVSADRLGEILCQLLDGHVQPGLIVRSPGLVSYAADETPVDRFQWDLVQALYLGGKYPMAERMEILQGAMKLDEINNFAMEQIALIPVKGIETVAPFLDRAEEVIQSISRLVPELSPLISWYQTEKIRIEPGTLEEVRTATQNVHERFRRHLHAYIPQETDMTEEVGDGTL